MFAKLHARFSNRGLGAATFVVLAVLFVGLTVLSDALFRGARLDLTEHRLYTLSEGTRNLVGNLDEPINLYFYFSRAPAREAPYLGIYATRVRELLEEIAAHSDGKLRLQVIDPAAVCFPYPGNPPQPAVVMLRHHGHAYRVMPQRHVDADHHRRTVGELVELRRARRPRTWCVRQPVLPVVGRWLVQPVAAELRLRNRPRLELRCDRVGV